MVMERDVEALGAPRTGLARPASRTPRNTTPVALFLDAGGTLVSPGSSSAATDLVRRHHSTPGLGT